MAAVTELATAVGTRAACLALWVPRGSVAVFFPSLVTNT